MIRRNFLVNLLLWILAFFFGYTIKREGEKLNLLKTNERMVLDKDGSNISEKIDIFSTQMADKANQLNSMSYNVMYPPAPLVGAKGNANYYKTADGKYYQDSGFTLLADDDTTAIQNIINAAQKSIGIVYFPAANYWTSGTLNITTSIFVYAHFKKGNTGLGYGKGATIRYSGTGDAIKVQHTDPTRWIYAMKIQGLRLTSDGSVAQNGIRINNLSELDILDCHFNGGFQNAGLKIKGLSISTIRNNNFTGNTYGIELINSTNSTSDINIENNNLWDNPTAHIKTNTLDAVNILNNHLEYSNTAILVVNDNDVTGNGNIVLSGVIENNNFLCSNTTKYPNPRALVFKSTVAGNLLYINQFIFKKNKVYMKGANYLIEFLKNGNTNGSSTCRRISIEDNLLMGASTAAINSDSTLFKFKLGNNEVQTGFLNDVAGTEITGTYKAVGIDSFYDYNKVNGTLRLGTTQPAVPTLGDLRVQSNTGSLRFFDGTAERIIVSILTGTAAPTTTPSFVGQVFIDTTNKIAYMAVGTSSSTDWKQINN
ncbi:right-handed parallel beta-helix repeat-containing protein [Bacillus sp. ISL-7]|uniref:right-handed parallel beta-helix repeat-containing protein n=1 Tax=Bacillus sp. ISL-7 TaxID=2819136 RepID=UPI001BE8BAF0|nr:right-handed parallel beta-helix repeat-containing protein [Bacillus sp. ISL-7]MBT2738093.1 hypothetical protein [Bacillus sp. ISL-7]